MLENKETQLQIKKVKIKNEINTTVMNTVGKKKFYACIQLNASSIQIYSDSLLGIFSMQSQNNLQFP